MLLAALVLAILLLLGLTAQLMQLRREKYRLTDQLANANQRQLELQSEITYLKQVQDTFINTADDAIILLDASQVVLLANPVAMELANTPMLGETLIASLRHNGIDELVHEVLGEEADLAERLLDIERQKFQARARRAETNRGTVCLLTLHNITALKRAELARREMVANVSHELRHPITSIGLLADTLQDDAVRKSKKGRKMLANIRREVDILTQLVQEMRDLSLIESGQMPIKLTPTNLRQPVASAVETQAALAENKSQTIALAVPEEISVLADAPYIERVVKNILHNAIKFTPEGGAVDISATASNGEVTIAIHDTGRGINREDLPRIFERFFQVDRSRNDGTGLGLAIARHIVRAHGGKIWVDSVEGQGTTFFFTLAEVDSPET
ncbi:MAG: PAS domain-containing sensor histidine kinase [Chloroflexi bacterium]|nr:PAS domain-containing sensor histidine kinase [Chloroflexota bacterium]